MGERCKKGRRRIAVVLASMHVEYVYRTLKGIRQEAEKNGIDIYVFNADVVTDETVKHTVGEYNIYSLANFDAFDGIILFPNLIQGHSVHHNLLERVKTSGVPTVCVDAIIGDFYHIGIENYFSMKSVVSHLIEEHGYTKINYLSGQDFNTDSQERLQAYCDALKEHGIPVEKNRIFKGAFTRVFGQEATLQMLESGEELPQAIVCATDLIALGVREVLLNHGIKIPEQVALTGFDNLFDARNAVPSITSVERNTLNVGEALVKKLVKILNGEPVPKSEHSPSFPVFAESCGCIPEYSNDMASVRSTYLDYKEKVEKKMQKGSLIVEELIDCRSFAEFIQKLKKFVKGFECKAFYLCLDKNFMEGLQWADREDWYGQLHDDLKTEGIPEQMMVALAYENDKFVSYGEFDSKEMLPMILDTQESQHVYNFTPLHFRDSFMGYVVLDKCEFAFENLIFYSWMLNLSISLESLRKQAQLRSMLKRLDHMYVVEPLTGLYNRFGFARCTADSFKRCIKMCGKFMILFADLDGLKIINDVYGHEKGDIAICAVADALKAACVGDEICARFGGDEYVVYAEGYSEEDAKAFGLRFEKNMADKNEELQQPFAIEASYGYITVKPRDGESIDKYIDMADNIMYFNKKTKKTKKKSQSLPQS